MSTVLAPERFWWLAATAVAVALLFLSACGDDRTGGRPTPTASPSPTPSPSPIQSVHQQFITDNQGRALILHGLNVSQSSKDDAQRMPWISRADAERVARDWGFNAVRLLIFWDAVEPAPGQLDDAYLDRVAERVEWFASAGVFVVLDMHQDVYGKLDVYGRALGFDGAPSWAGRTDGLPHRVVDPWALTYLQAGVRRAFDNFWDDTGPNRDLQEHYAAAWAHVAARFKDDPWVLGYDLMNEPFAGNAFYGELGGATFGDHARSLEFHRTKFLRFHERMIAAIRAVHPDAWIFYEPTVFLTVNGGPSDLGVLRDTRAGENRLVYFPHLYPTSPELSRYYDPANAPELDNWQRERTREVQEQRGPMLIGEFGMPFDAGGDPLGYLRRILNLADAITSGWAFWEYGQGGWSPVGGPDLHENPNVNVLVRTYAQRVAGQPLLYGYDPQTRVFDLTFADRAGVSGPTELYVPARRFYPDGWRVDVSDPPGTWTSTWDATREVLSVSTTPTGATHQIRVSPGAAQIPQQ